MNKNKYSLRAVLLNEAVISVGFMDYNISPTTDFAKALRGETAETIDFSKAQITDYIADGQPVVQKRDELGLIMLLDMLRGGVAAKLGSGDGRDASKAASGTVESMVTAVFPGSVNINNQAFSNNEPFADVFTDDTWISVKFTGEPGSSKIKQRQIPQMLDSLKDKGRSKANNKNNFQAIEIAVSNNEIVINTYGPAMKNDFLDGFSSEAAKSAGIGAMKGRAENVPSTTTTVSLPGKDFFKGLEKEGFIAGEELAKSTASPSDNITAKNRRDGITSEIPEEMTTYSGAYNTISDRLTDKIGDFSTKTGKLGAESVRNLNDLQKLVITAMDSLKSGNFSKKSLQDLQAELQMAVLAVDDIDGQVDSKVNLRDEAKNESKINHVSRWHVLAGLKK